MTGARRRVPGVLAGLAVLVGAAACGSATSSGAATSPTSPPLTAAQLRTRLLPAHMANGWTAEPYADPATGGVTPDDAAHCRLLWGADVVISATSEASAVASADLLGGTGRDKARLGGEEDLYAFRADGAHRALDAMRATVARCPRTTQSDAPLAANTETTTFAAAPGPRLGDESLTLRVTVTDSTHPGVVQRADAFVVRVGGTLVVVEARVPAYPEQVGALPAVVPLAVTQFTAARPQPVDRSSIQL